MLAERVGVPVVPGMTLDLGDAESLQAAQEFCDEHLPVLVKAAHGGGGRGMRVVRAGDELDEAMREASSEARSAFGSPVVFLEKLLENVSHIEVQVLGDLEGNLVHLHERDCSVQRRHQKVIEVAPAPGLNAVMCGRLHDDALKIAAAANYHNAGTVEFLVSGDDDDYYFIEANPRLQVEHTVTEQITGIDLVQSQIRISEGHALASNEIGIFGRSSIQTRGYAVQCRITTEDPANDFMPDSGEILAYRSASGPGIRLDVGNGYVGANVSPHYDSLLVKVTAYANSFHQAIHKAVRALREFRVRGVKTNMAFLQKVLLHDTFKAGKAYTSFVDETPELCELEISRDRATRLLGYLADVIVNGHPTIGKQHGKDRRLSPPNFRTAPIPELPDGEPPDGTTRILEERGTTGLVDWVKDQPHPLLTDTTMRDAHQSLIATRMRTHDLLRIAPATAHFASQLFSMEVWGGATFDVAYRFLNEDPWDRLRKLKKAVPNLLLQMLLRGANAVGYTSYPNNVVEAFIDEAAKTGVDVFRVFDSLNDLENMQVAVDRILQTPKVAEVCMCYTGDVANPYRKKYNLDYYTDLARRIEDMGAHILCIKDMAGLLRPRAATMLVKGLKECVDLPIHLHTHDTSGNGVASLLAAIDAGVDIVDVAFAPMAGMTSQPSMNALIAALRGGDRETGMGNKALQPIADYWEVVREYYRPFESGLLSGTSEVYYHEIPGGQYSNLRPQAASLGLLDRWQDIKHAFAVVNQLVGDIPKVTPSSKMVGDFANLLVQKDLLVMTGDFAESVRETWKTVLRAAPKLDFPVSVVNYFQGHLGQPPGGFPQDLQHAILKGLPVVHGRRADLLPQDLGEIEKDLLEKHGRQPKHHEVISAALYPRVMDDHCRFRIRHGDVSILDTPTYFYGLEQDQEIWVDLEPGKTLVITLDAVSDPSEDGMCTVYFDLNGQVRQIQVLDRSLSADVITR
ncbi:MAG: pyruvate carboxylase, partial [Planctomycetota bacterium]